MSSASHHQYGKASRIAAHQLPLSSQNVTLNVVQHPQTGRVSVGKEKDRKPIDPPPVVKLDIHFPGDASRDYMHSPYFFMTVTLLAPVDISPSKSANGFGGTTVSSVHKLKDGGDFNNEGAFFVFADLSVKLEGRFRLQFHLFQCVSPELNAGCTYITSTVSDDFIVHSAKGWPGMSESTSLTRAFSDQGVRLRLRKEPRTMLKKNGPAHDNYEPRQYRKNQRQGKESVKASENPQRNPHSPIEAQNSIDDEFSQSQGISGRIYSQPQQEFSDIGQYGEPASKRQRTSSMPFGRISSASSPQMGLPDMYADHQQVPFSYNQTPHETPQNVYYGMMPAAPASLPLRNTQFRRHTYGPQYDQHVHRSAMIHQTPANHQFSQLGQNLGLPRRQESTEEHEYTTFSTQPQTTMALLGSMAPPTLGRMGNTAFVFGNRADTLGTAFQPDLGQSPSLSGGALFPPNRNSTNMSTTTSTPSLENSMY